MSGSQGSRIPPAPVSLTSVVPGELPRLSCWDQAIGPSVAVLAPVGGIGRAGAEVGQRAKEASQPPPPKKNKNKIQPFIWRGLHPRRMEKSEALPCSPGCGSGSFQLLCALPRSLAQCHRVTPAQASTGPQIYRDLAC